MAVVLASVVLAAVPIAAGSGSSASPAPAATRGGAIPGELIVRFERSASAADRREARAAANVRIERSLRLPRAQLLEVKPGRTVASAIQTLERDPDVAYAEPNRRRSIAAGPTDPRFGELWGLHNTGQLVDGVAGTPGADIDALSAWEVTTGSPEVLVAIVDTGMDREHEDLAANAWTNPGEAGAKRTNGVDDDGNGYVDDWRGWDFAYGDDDPHDGHSHGTHVAGTIGAVGDNGIGVAGVNHRVSLVGVKVLDDGGSGTDADVADGFFYAGRIGAKVANASLGGEGLSEVIADSMRASPDTLFVVAAGNSSENVDSHPFSPCAEPVDNLMCVAATTNTDELAWFSNYGRETVDLGAPGTYTLSTVPGGYDEYSGTSMATPHVAGGAALMLAAHPGESPLEMKQRILAGAEPVGALAGRTVSGARLDLRGALGLAPNVRPVARLSVSPARPRVQGRVTLDASATTDSDGRIVSHEWDLDGNGSYERSSGATAAIPYAFPSAGTTRVGLRVRDDRGGVGSVQLDVSVDPAPADVPVARADHRPQPVYAGEPVTLDAGASSDDAGIVSYAWDLDGDWDYEVESAGPTHDHTFPKAGTRDVGLRVRDTTGNESEHRFAVRVELSPPRPEFDFEPRDPVRNETVQFDASASRDEDGHIRWWAWDFNGDGWSDSQGDPAPAWTYTTPGPKEVTLTVVDNDGQVARVTHTVEVQDGAPLEAEGAADFTERGGEADGDGVIEPGEGVELDQALRNHGGSDATGITGSLRSLEGPNVEPAGRGSWPDLPPGEAARPSPRPAANTYGSAQCGAPIEVELSIQTDQGRAAVPMEIPETGAPGTTQPTFSMPGLPYTLAPGRWVYMTGGAEQELDGAIKDVDVRVRDVRHPNVGDLVIAVESPETEIFDDLVTVIARRGGSGDDIVDAVFDDEASVPVEQGTAPFTGRFRPDEPLSRLDGQNANGSWGLYVENWSDTDSALLNDLGVDVTPAHCRDQRHEPPTAVLDADTWSPSPGYPVTFDASASSDDGRIVSYRWDKDGDGRYETTTKEPTLKVSYPGPDYGYIGLMVIDDMRAVDTYETAFAMSDNMDPTARFELPGDVVAGRSAHYDASSSTDPDGRIVAWDWYFGQFPGGDSVSGPEVDYSFRDSGLQNVSLWVKDEKGGTGQNGTLIFVQPPFAAPAPEGRTDPFPGPGSGLYPPEPGGPDTRIVEPMPQPPPHPAGQPPKLTIATERRQRMTALERGVPAKVGCESACRLIAKLTLRGKDARRLGLTKKAKPIQIARAQRVLERGGTAKMRLKPNARVIRALRRAKLVRLEFGVSATGPGGISRSAYPLELRR